MVGGGWQWLVIGDWSPLAVDGGWGLAVGGGWWSLGAVLNKQKTLVPKGPPDDTSDGAGGDATSEAALGVTSDGANLDDGVWLCAAAQLAGCGWAWLCVWLGVALCAAVCSCLHSPVWLCVTHVWRCLAMCGCMCEEGRTQREGYSGSAGHTATGPPCAIHPLLLPLYAFVPFANGR